MPVKLLVSAEGGCPVAGPFLWEVELWAPSCDGASGPSSLCFRCRHRCCRVAVGRGLAACCNRESKLPCCFWKGLARHLHGVWCGLCEHLGSLQWVRFQASPNIPIFTASPPPIFPSFHTVGLSTMKCLMWCCTICHRSLYRHNTCFPVGVLLGFT